MTDYYFLRHHFPLLPVCGKTQPSGAWRVLWTLIPPPGVSVHSFVRVSA
jgi:hypothetical protein